VIAAFRGMLDEIVSLESEKTDMKAICFELALALMECSHARVAMQIGMAKITKPEAFALALELASRSINDVVTKKGKA
jgi:hypothetical protein